MLVRIILSVVLLHTTTYVIADIEQHVGKNIYIRIFKEENILEIFVQEGKHYKLAKNYDICKYSGTLGPKKNEGDLQAPEGFYGATLDKLNPNSQFFLSFDIGYPNLYDRYYQRTGGFIMVHGECVSNGCFAMTNTQIIEIYRMMRNAFGGGQEEVSIHIYPFRLTKYNLKKHFFSEHYEFWEELKTGYDYFEKHKLPPVIDVVDGKYILAKTHK